MAQLFQIVKQSRIDGRIYYDAVKADKFEKVVAIFELPRTYWFKQIKAMRWKGRYWFLLRRISY